MRSAFFLQRVYDKLTHSFNFGLLDAKLSELQLKRSEKIDPEGPCLMFSAYETKYLANTYMYQDMTVDYVYRMWKSKSDLSKFTPLPLKTKERVVLKRLEKNKRVNENCRGLFTMSKWLANDMIENMGLPPEKIHYVGGGCNLDTNLIDTSKKNGRRFLFVGKDFERKGGITVIEAFKILREKYNDIELYIVGSKDIPDNLKNISGVYNPGLLPYKEVAELFNLCDFFVLPSQLEAYGIVFAEALIFGLPCIGKNIYAMPEFIENDFNGYLINDNDPEELCSRMEQLLQERGRLVSNVQNMRDAYIKKYSWRSVVLRMLDVFRRDGF